MAERAESPSASRIAVLAVLIGLAALVLVIALKHRSNQAVLIDTRSQILELEKKVTALRDAREKLVREGSQSRIERDEERERVQDLEEKLTEATTALDRARSELVRVRREREEHLAARLDLEVRLEAAMSELAK
jgi:TolA-binding protein